MVRHTKLGIIVLVAIIASLIIIPQYRHYRMAIRIVEIETENRKREVERLEKIEAHASEFAADLEHAKRRFNQLTMMFPENLNTESFINNVTVWMEESGFTPISISHIEETGDFHSEATINFVLPFGQNEIDELLDGPQPWHRLVVRHTEKMADGGTLLKLKLFAISDLPPAIPSSPCSVPDFRVWLWPLGAKIVTHTKELEALCAHLEPNREILAAHQSFIDLRRQIEYVEQISAAVVHLE
ncbi:MAG: hypothetical protein GY906_26390 [bacterium]|nr:hypothetical protein [bacterium]